MKSHDGFIQGYNAQAAVDADSQVIVAQTLTNNASDAAATRDDGRPDQAQYRKAG